MIEVDPDLSGPLELRVAEFHLRPLDSSDARDMLTHLGDSRVVEFMDLDPLSDIEDAHQIIDWAAGQRALGAGVRWAIRDSSGSFVGTCGFNQLIVERGRRSEVAYDLGHAWWGRGVMSKILPELVDFALRRLELHRIEAMVTPGNLRSCRLLERHGFSLEGELRGYSFWKGRYWNQLVYARVASDEPPR